MEVAIRAIKLGGGVGMDELLKNPGKAEHKLYTNDHKEPGSLWYAHPHTSVIV